MPFGWTPAGIAVIRPEIIEIGAFLWTINAYTFFEQYIDSYQLVELLCCIFNLHIRFKVFVQNIARNSACT